MKDVKVLLVEDEPIPAMEIKSTLTELGYSVVGVEKRGTDALEVLEAETPSLIVMDIHLEGEKDGIEVARVVREKYSIPIVYLTAHSDEETLNRARGTEPEGYLVKPITEEDLESTLTMALARAGKNME